MFWSKKKEITETYSQYGIPGHLFLQRDFGLKIVIDPPREYFTGKLKKDKKNFDKLLLIHGCETPDINDIGSEVLKHASEFTKVLSFDPEVVAKHSNAQLFCFGSCWVLTNKTGALTNLPDEYSNIFSTDKKFQLSFIHSKKKELPGHKMRYEMAPLLENKYAFDLFFPKERIETKLPLFKDAMFHLTIENSRYTNYITEKIIDCFMSYTIPIYWGCPNIGDYFDTNGMIIFNSKEELPVILGNLTPELYKSKLSAIQHNYEVAKKDFAFFFDRVNKVIATL